MLVMYRAVAWFVELVNCSEQLLKVLILRPKREILQIQLIASCMCNLYDSVPWEFIKSPATA